MSLWAQNSLATSHSGEESLEGVARKAGSGNSLQPSGLEDPPALSGRAEAEPQSLSEPPVTYDTFPSEALLAGEVQVCLNELDGVTAKWIHAPLPFTPQDGPGQTSGSGRSVFSTLTLQPPTLNSTPSLVPSTSQSLPSQHACRACSPRRRHSSGSS